jgi:hypothetical protein
MPTSYWSGIEKPQSQLPAAAAAAWNQSNSLQQAGLLASPVPILGDALGLMGDVQMYQEQPDQRTPFNYGLSMMGLLPFVPGMTGWHGSPHKFTKPDISKIGTGEGAQAYGHGLYVAENMDVAKGYSPRDYGTEDQLLNRYQNLANGEDYTGADVYERAMMHETPSEIRKYYADLENGFDAADRATAMQHIDDYEDLYKSSESYLYKVDVPDADIEKMLDWDKSLSEQSDYVQGLLGSIKEKTAKSFPHMRNADMTGAGLYHAYAGHRGGHPQFASEGLNELGIPGIKYWDQGSRGAGEGTRNFVIFDPERIKMLERNEQQIEGLL